MKKYADIESFYHDLKPWQQKQFNIARKLILSSIPEVVEGIKYTVPFYTYKGLLFYFALHKNKIFILGFCNGVHMSDEYGLLKADSGQTYIRHWIFEEHKPLKSEILQQYIHEAVLVNDHLALLKKKK